MTSRPDRGGLNGFENCFARWRENSIMNSLYGSLNLNGENNLWGDPPTSYTEVAQRFAGKPPLTSFTYPAMTAVNVPWPATA